MLPSPLRLKRASDINKVYARGRSGGGQQLFVKSLRTGLPHSRAVVVVGKKVSKKAVVRNLLRRRTSQQLRQLWSRVLPGYDMVVTITADVSAISPQELHTMLEKALARAGVAQ